MNLHLHLRPRNLWKSISFWLGILSLAFIGWASWDSGRLVSGGTWHEWTLMRRDHHTILTRWPGKHFEGLSVGRDPNDYVLTVGEMAARWRQAGGEVRVMPDLVMAIIVLIIWAGWLAWRQRRWKTPIQ
ncbi:hypothetical protein OKA05_24125 [Luteolibacter arcticus]|uniref:PepSY domain-containing protein n=1 Tax=Luteolibacter arcticus TaxID=1581411 RepID=A0ABT3GQ82_9BACT|nr:hypothetical protein [Luteolibacter arcticus]MCW1925667.1 hypothetical protein [Luteolibacter arcticus]